MNTCSNCGCPIEEGNLCPDCSKVNYDELEEELEEEEGEEGE
jgi:ribosomal protein L32